MTETILTGASSWRLGKELGHGGQGEVYEAYLADDPNGNCYALKRLSRGGRSGQDRPEELRELRFRSEAGVLRVLSLVGCPGIVRVIDADLSAENAMPWFVMPLYRAGAMWQAKRKPPYLEPYVGALDRVLAIAAQVARTLSFMHTLSPGYVHRDVKCANILFDSVGGAPVLGDFGLVSDKTREGPETALGDRIGPGRWRPPELRRGGIERRHPGTDVYLLGGVIYEALTGGETLDEIEHVGQFFAHERGEFHLARFVNDPRLNFVNVMLRGMFRRDPDLRLTAQSVADLCEEIMNWKPGDVAPAVQPSLNAAEQAAAEYRQRSRAVYEEAIRTELDATCRNVAGAFGLNSWAPLNEVTLMIDVNQDAEPIEAAKSLFPGSVWMAVRVLAAFETHGARPIFMSYVLLGRPSPSKEVVGVVSEDKQWRELASGAPGAPGHQQVMRDAVASEKIRLLEKLAGAIRGLR